MADPDFIDNARTQIKVLAVLRKHKLSEKIISEVSEQFRGHRPTMRAKTQTAAPPKVRRTGAMYSLEGSDIRYRQGYSYIAVLGDDGVDKNQPLWVVVCPTVDAERVRLEIRELARQHGFRSISQHTKHEIHLFPRKGCGILRAVAVKHPGLYLQSRWTTSVNEILDLVVVHPK